MYQLKPLPQSTNTNGAIPKPVIQPKLTIGRTGDKYEQEADAVANRVMRMSKDTIQMQPIEEEEEMLQPKLRMQPIEEEEELLQPKTVNASQTKPENISSRLSNSKTRGTPLPDSINNFMSNAFDADFSSVKVHTDINAVQMSQQLGAKAFTYQNNIYFNRGQYDPSSTHGKHLLAHELTHVVQQQDSFIQRAISDEEITRTPVTNILSDETYFENGITSIEFYEALLAVLHYGDGTRIRLGLVPDQLDSSVPIAGVDYITPASSHIRVDPDTTGRVRFIPHGTEVAPAPGSTLSDVIRDFGQDITFSHDPRSGRIVPSIVNSITAPRLCEVLFEARTEYARRMDTMAEGMVEALEMMELIVILASFLPSGGSSAAGSGTRAAAGRGAAATGTGVIGRGSSYLTSLFTRLLRSGSTEAMAVAEGVEFHTVRVIMRESEMIITRFGIRNASRIPGRGRLMHAAYERAAIAAAREAGARTVAVRLETVVNPAWRTYLESQGYVLRFIEHATGGSNMIVKIITL